MRDEGLYSVQTIPLEHKRLFGRDVDLYEVIELLPIILRATHAVPPEHIFISTKTEDFKVILPCVYYSVKYAVTPLGHWHDFEYDRIIKSGQGILVNYDMESWRGSHVEASGDVVINQVASAVKVNSNFPTRTNGKYVDYHARGNVMEFEFDNLPVHILLTVMPVDEKGYPLVTEKVITATAYFLNLVHIQKRYYSGQLPQYVFHDAKRDYEEKLGETLTPEVMSDNEIHDIMNMLSSYHRHQYEKPFGR